MDQALADYLHEESAAIRPRCWCGCPEAGHTHVRVQNQRSRPCERCGGLCVQYLPHTREAGATAAHHAARARSEMQVRHVREALEPFTRPLPRPDIPAPRRAPTAESRPRPRLRRMDP